jgi:hypothetical protein
MAKSYRTEAGRRVPYPRSRPTRQGLVLVGHRMGHEQWRVGGEEHPQAKLTEADVQHIREMHAEGWGYRRLAKKFEVSKSLIERIVKHLARVHG